MWNHIESRLNSLIYNLLFQSLVACLYCTPFNQLLQLPPGHTSGNLIYISNFSVIERISTLSSKRQGSSIWVAHSIKFSSLTRGRNCSLQASRDPALSPQDDKLTTQYAPLRGVAPSISRTWIGGYFDYRPGLWFYHKSGIECSIILFQVESESLNSNKWNLQCDFTKN